MPARQWAHVGTCAYKAHAKAHVHRFLDFSWPDNAFTETVIERTADFLDLQFYPGGQMLSGGDRSPQGGIYKARKVTREDHQPTVCGSAFGPAAGT